MAKLLSFVFADAYLPPTHSQEDFFNRPDEFHSRISPLLTGAKKMNSAIWAISILGLSLNRVGRQEGLRKRRLFSRQPSARIIRHWRLVIQSDPLRNH